MPLKKVHSKLNSGSRFKVALDPTNGTDARNPLSFVPVSTKKNLKTKVFHSTSSLKTIKHLVSGLLK